MDLLIANGKRLRTERLTPVKKRKKNKFMLVFIPNADLSTIATNRRRKVAGNSQTVFLLNQ